MMPERFALDDRIGNYRVEGQIGVSLTGVLYQAAHALLPRRAVIKVMHASQRPQLGVLLLREACILEALQHEGAPRVYESGVLPDRRPWFTMEWVAGETLAERLANGPLEPIEVAALIRDVAEVLSHAHRRGVIHRALVPDKIVFTPGRLFRLCITDWSDARTHDATTATAQIGTPSSRHYIAPELARGDVIDDRADVYALGVIGYQALTGVRPYATPGDHVPAAERCPIAPVELTQIIDQMVAADRFDRPSATEVNTDLGDLVMAFATAEVTEYELEDDDGTAAATIRFRHPRWTPFHAFSHTVDGVVVDPDVLERAPD